MRFFQRWFSFLEIWRFSLCSILHSIFRSAHMPYGWGWRMAGVELRMEANDDMDINLHDATCRQILVKCRKWWIFLGEMAIPRWNTGLSSDSKNLCGVLYRGAVSRSFFLIYQEAWQMHPNASKSFHGLHVGVSSSSWRTLMARWFTMENPINGWLGCTPILGNLMKPHFRIFFFSSLEPCNGSTSMPRQKISLRLSAIWYGLIHFKQEELSLGNHIMKTEDWFIWGFPEMKVPHFSVFFL